MSGARRVGRQLQVGDDLAQEEPRAVLGVEQAGVLAPRPEAGRGRVGALHDRPGVHVDARLQRARAPRQALAPAARASPSSRRGSRRPRRSARSSRGRPAPRSSTGAGVSYCRPDAQHASAPTGTRRAGRRGVSRWRGEVRHLARVAARDPLREVGQLGGGVRRRDAGQVEAGLEREGPGARGARAGLHRRRAARVRFARARGATSPRSRADLLLPFRERARASPRTIGTPRKRAVVHDAAERLEAEDALADAARGGRRRLPSPFFESFRCMAFSLREARPCGRRPSSCARSLRGVAMS